MLKINAWSRKTLVVGALVAATLAGTAYAFDRGHQGGGMHEGGGRHGMMMAGRGMERMLDAVNATPEQRTKIKAITEAAQADMKKMHEGQQGQDRQAMMALLAAPTVDAQAIERLRAAGLAKHDAGSKRMTQTMIDVANVLTPAQRASFAAKMKERGERMGRHGGRHGEGQHGQAPALPASK